jgi:hypothetical protein
MEKLIEADSERLRSGQVGTSDVNVLTTRLFHLARAVRELPDTVEATAVRAEILGLIADLEQLRLIQSGTWWVGAKKPR